MDYFYIYLYLDRCLANTGLSIPEAARHLERSTKTVYRYLYRLRDFTGNDTYYDHSCTRHFYVNQTSVFTKETHAKCPI